MIGDFGKGFGYALDGLRSLGRPGLRRYVALPLAVNLAMFAVGGWWIAVSLGDLVDWVQRYLPEWLDWLAWLLLIATVVSGISGDEAIAWLLRYLMKHTTMVFVAYRIALGLAVVCLVVLGWMEP